MSGKELSDGDRIRFELEVQNSAPSLSSLKKTPLPELSTDFQRMVSIMDLEKLANPLEANPGQRLGRRDVQRLATILGRNFHNEPNLVYLFPDEQERRLLSHSLFRSAIRAGQLYGEINVTEEQDSVAVWIRPEHDLSFRRLMRAELMAVPFNRGWEHTTRYMKLAASLEASRQCTGGRWVSSSAMPRLEINLSRCSTSSLM
jgi:hypothetical protein